MAGVTLLSFLAAVVDRSGLVSSWRSDEPAGGNLVAPLHPP